MHIYIKNVLSTKVHKDRGKFQAQTIAKRAQKNHMRVCVCTCVSVDMVSIVGKKKTHCKKNQSSL